MKIRSIIITGLLTISANSYAGACRLTNSFSCKLNKDIKISNSTKGQKFSCKTNYKSGYAKMCTDTHIEKSGIEGFVKNGTDIKWVEVKIGNKNVYLKDPGLKAGNINKINSYEDLLNFPKVVNALRGQKIDIRKIKQMKGTPELKIGLTNKANFYKSHKEDNNDLVDGTYEDGNCTFTGEPTVFKISENTKNICIARVNCLIEDPSDKQKILGGGSAIETQVVCEAMADNGCKTAANCFKDQSVQRVKEFANPEQSDSSEQSSSMR